MLTTATQALTFKNADEFFKFCHFGLKKWLKMNYSFTLILYFTWYLALDVLGAFRV